jgi:hypothetical protein
MVMSPAGLGTKNDCAGYCQQQFTWPPDRPIHRGQGLTEFWLEWLAEWVELVEEMCVCVEEGVFSPVISTRGAVTNSSQIPILVEEETPFQNTLKVLERTKIWSWFTKGPNTKIGCAGETQRQFPRPTDRYTDTQRARWCYKIFFSK